MVHLQEWACLHSIPASPCSGMWTDEDGCRVSVHTYTCTHTHVFISNVALFTRVGGMVMYVRERYGGGVVRYGMGRSGATMGGCGVCACLSV